MNRNMFSFCLKASVLTILILLLAGVFSAAPAEASDDPQLVFFRFVDAVHSGDINTIKTLIYSDEKMLWDKRPNEMLNMERANLPKNPNLISKDVTQEFQYQITVLKFSGVSPKNNKPVTGEVRMILEDGKWKVSQRFWR